MVPFSLHVLFIELNGVVVVVDVVSSNLDQSEVYSITGYVIKFVSDLRQVCGFLWVLQFSPPIKLTIAIYLKYCLKWR